MKILQRFTNLFIARNAEEKIDTSKLTKEIATPALEGVRTVEYEIISTSMTPSKLGSTIASVLEGDATDYLTLAEEMEERDCHYRAVLGVRKGALTSLIPTVTVQNSEDAKLNEIAEDVRNLVSTPEFLDMLTSLTDALGKGYSVCEIMWEEINGKWIPTHYIWRDPRFFQLDNLTNTLRLRDDDKEEGVEIPANKFVIFMPKLKCGLQIRNGLALIGAWVYVFKSYSLRDWLAFTEAYGMPLRLGKYDASASEEDRKVLLKAVAGISTDMGAIIPSDMSIEFVQGLTSGSSNNNIYQALIEWLDSQVSKAILGQTMTTDDGASLSQAQVHDKVRTDILMSDARQLANTISKQLIQPYIDINYGAQEVYPKFELLKEEKEDVTALVDNITKLVPFGLTVSQAEVRSKLGLKEPANDEAVLKQQEITGFGAMNSMYHAGNARALNAIDREGAFDPELELAYLEEELRSKWKRVVDPLLEPIYKKMEACETLEEFYKLLPELAEKIDGNELLKLIATAQFKLEEVNSNA